MCVEARIVLEENSMKFYGFRFFTAFELLLDHLELTADWKRRVLPEKYDENYAMEWAESMREELDDLRRGRKTKLVRSERKIAEYRKYARLAYAFAKEQTYDILISDETGEYALILLYVDSIFFTDKEKKDVKMFTALLEMADEIYIDPDEDILRIKLVYDLCDAVERE